MEPFFTESWKQVTGSKYEISCGGRVRRVCSKRFLRTSLHSGGYRTVAIHGKTRTVHSLVLEAFVGKRPPAAVINHLNGTKKDNRLENLEYCSQKQNYAHARSTGLAPFAPARKLTDRQVKRVKQLLSGFKIHNHEIAQIFGVCRSQIGFIKNGKKWKHVS